MQYTCEIITHEGEPQCCHDYTGVSHKHDSQDYKPHPKEVGGKYLGDRALNYIIMR